MLGYPLSVTARLFALGGFARVVSATLPISRRDQGDLLRLPGESVVRSNLTALSLPEAHPPEVNTAPTMTTGFSKEYDPPQACKKSIVAPSQGSRWSTARHQQKVVGKHSPESQICPERRRLLQVQVVAVWLVYAAAPNWGGWSTGRGTAPDQFHGGVRPPGEIAVAASGAAAGHQADVSPAYWRRQDLAATSYRLASRPRYDSRLMGGAGDRSLLRQQRQWK